MKLVPRLGRLITALALIQGLTAALPASATPGQAGSKGEEFHYRYVDLDNFGLDSSSFLISSRLTIAVGFTAPSTLVLMSLARNMSLSMHMGP